MAYSELVKNFSRIREYMREFYVYGFKGREEYTAKSARSYDDERRRMESYLGDSMRFTQTPAGKRVFISIDSRTVRHNPLYAAWKAKSFTDGDITLHFLLFDILDTPATALPLADITAALDDRLAVFPSPRLFDASTVRKKLGEYVSEGLIETEKRGKTLYYRRAADAPILDAAVLDFFSEVAPCGVIGSYLLDRTAPHTDLFTFKHHYITGTTDSEILYALFGAMRAQRFVTLQVVNRRRGGTFSEHVVPLRIFISVQSGRQYLLAYAERTGRITSFRTDNIAAVEAGEVCGRFAVLRQKLDGMRPSAHKTTRATAWSMWSSPCATATTRRISTDGSSARSAAAVWSVSTRTPAAFRRSSLTALRSCPGCARFSAASCPIASPTRRSANSLGGTSRQCTACTASRTRKGAAAVIFSERYGAYYNAVAAVLRAAIDHPLEKGELRAIIAEHAFGESVLQIEPALTDGRWQLLAADGSTPLRHAPTLPLTLTERRWQKAILLDPRIRLFTDTPPDADDVEPLFLPEDICVFDRYADGDPYTDAGYIRRFRLILDAIRQKQPLRVDMTNRRGSILHITLLPVRLEYSEKDDKFRLIGEGGSSAATVNLARIVHCERFTGGCAPVPLRRRVPKRRQVVLEMVDQRNTPERVLMHFAHFEKRAERLADDRCRVTILYDWDDETEMVIRILSFGPTVRVVEPAHFVSLMRERLLKQKSCGQ